MRVAKIFRFGDSTAIVVPKGILKTQGWLPGDFLVMQIFEKDVVLSKLEFPAHVIKRLSEKRQRVWETLKEVK